MKMQESGENYLESILVLSQQKGMVRSIDVVNAMNFSKPSISNAMRRLRENGYIRMERTGWITLTDKGREVAEAVYERHRLLTGYLVKLGVSEKTAAEDACRIEHVLSQETFDCIKNHAESHGGAAPQEP
jgi:Mn-dependent DtxR family transcriptional regulator